MITLHAEGTTIGAGLARRQADGAHAIVNILSKATFAHRFVGSGTTIGL